MGYTHYWTQNRSFTADEWVEVSEHVREILSYVENSLGVALAGNFGKGGTRPKFTTSTITFNGIGDDACETFMIRRTRTKATDYSRTGADFCKTNRNPYDVAVTACLCYLSSVAGTFAVSSNGRGHNFLAGLDAARNALPAKANILDIPMGVMQDDRWTGPWVSVEADSGYEVHFCINGKGYVLNRKSGESYCAPRDELARFLDANKSATFRTGGRACFGDYGREEPNIWDAMGSFDPARNKRLARAQGKALARLFPVAPDHAEQPPAYVRPSDMPRPEDAGEFCYSLSDLLRKVGQKVPA